MKVTNLSLNLRHDHRIIYLILYVLATYLKLVLSDAGENLIYTHECSYTQPFFY